MIELYHEGDWLPLCPESELVPGRGVAALLGEEEQVAVFLTPQGDLYAVGNRDPFSQAEVISRGLVGSRGEAPTVASPMYKQVFDLRTGRCLDEEATPAGAPAHLPTWPIRRT